MILLTIRGLQIFFIYILHLRFARCDLLALFAPSDISLYGISGGPSLIDKLTEWSGLPVNPQRNLEVNDTAFVEGSCDDALDRAKLITKSISKAVNFYERNWKELTAVDSAVGLQVLVGALNKVSDRRIQNQAEFEELSTRAQVLVDQILDHTTDLIQDEDMKKEIQKLVSYGELWTSYSHEWKSPGGIAKLRNASFEIGNDKEVIWGVLNRECQIALINRCEVPYICQRTFLDAEPQSQYMLSHQVLYILFAKRRSCDEQQPAAFSGLEQLLETHCAKMFREASFLAEHGFPEWGRDIFAEYVFICGQAGYSNFLRRDWVDAVLSWQSPVGCFVNPALTAKNYQTTDQGVGVGGDCLPHLSSLSLASLVVQLAWYFDRCLPLSMGYDDIILPV